MSFSEDWLTKDVAFKLDELASNAVPGLVVEIGAWEGRSTVVLANAINPRTLHTVDTWAGCSSDDTGLLAARRDVFARWRENVEQLTFANVEAHRMDWRSFIPTIDEPVAFAFIDAEHTYQEVFDNIQALKPLMADGGILCGDDITHPPVQEAVNKAIGIARFAIHDRLWWWVA